MSEFSTVSPRNYARYQGKTYVAHERVASSVRLNDIDTGNEIAAVPIDDLDEWYATTVKGIFLDHDFQVLMENSESYLLLFIAGDGQWAARTWAQEDKYPGCSFSQLDRFTFEVTVPKEMVTDAHEERRDILGPWRRKQEGLR